MPDAAALDGPPGRPTRIPRADTAAPIGRRTEGGSDKDPDEGPRRVEPAPTRIALAPAADPKMASETIPRWLGGGVLAFRGLPARSGARVMRPSRSQSVLRRRAGRTAAGREGRTSDA